MTVVAARPPSRSVNSRYSLVCLTNVAVVVGSLHSRQIYMYEDKALKIV